MVIDQVLGGRWYHFEPEKLRLVFSNSYTHLNFPQPLSVQVVTYAVFSRINIILPLWVTFIMLGSNQMDKVS